MDSAPYPFECPPNMMNCRNSLSIEHRSFFLEQVFRKLFFINWLSFLIMHELTGLLYYLYEILCPFYLEKTNLYKLNKQKAIIFLADFDPFNEILKGNQ